MFEALFILTTIDAGTRIARFLVQEFLGRIWKPLGDLHWWPAAFLSTGLVVFGWGYFIYTGSVETIWPMFGMANQLLAVIALAVVTTILFNTGRGRYAPVTLLPMLFVATTTTTTAYYEIYGRFWKKMVLEAGRAGARLAQYRADGDASGVRGGDRGLGDLAMGNSGAVRRSVRREARNQGLTERSVSAGARGVRPPSRRTWSTSLRTSNSSTAPVP